MIDPHTYEVAEQRVAMVARDVADSKEGQYRPALAGEALVPVLWEDLRCTDEGCDAVSFGWRPIRLNDLKRVERAMGLGCDGLCGCRCHD